MTSGGDFGANAGPNRRWSQARHRDERERATLSINELLIRILDESFGRAGWHGPTLLNALRGVSGAEASWKPTPERHSIWELALHAGYWKYTVRRRLTGAPRGSFPRKPSNFPALPEQPDDASWAADVALLRDEHARLREVVANLPPAALDTKPAKSKWTNAAHIYGVAAHDAYHAGQIQLLKRLRTGKKR